MRSFLMAENIPLCIWFSQGVYIFLPRASGSIAIGAICLTAFLHPNSSSLSFCEVSNCSKNLIVSRFLDYHRFSDGIFFPPTAIGTMEEMANYNMPSICHRFRKDGFG